MTPQLSIIVVNFDGGVELLNCLRSLTENFGEARIELIVADNGSSDGSLDRAEQLFPLFKYLRLGNNFGFAAACNRAIEVAHGRHLMLLNPDTEVEPDALEILMQALDQHPQWGIVGPLMTDMSGRPYRAARRFPTPLYLFCEVTGLSKVFPRSKFFAGYLYGEKRIEELESVDQIEGSALAISQEAFRSVGKLDEQFFIFFEEVDWCKRVRDAGFEIHVVFDARVKHIRSGTMSRHFINIRKIHAESAMKYFLKHEGLQGLKRLRRWMRAGLWIREWILRIAMLLDPVIGQDYAPKPRARARSLQTRTGELKILHVLSSPHLGGAEMMCLMLAREQIANGHEAAIHFFETGASSNKALEWNVPVYAYRQREIKEGLQKTLEAFRPNIVHSHVPKTNLICSRAIDNSIPWITTIHGSWRQFGYSPDALGNPMKKGYLMLRHAVGDYWTTRNAARIVAISEYVKKELQIIGVTANKITVIHDGLPFEPTPVSQSSARARMSLPESSFVVGSLGHMAPVKGFDVLIRAFAKIAEQNKNACLVIAGGDVMGDTIVRKSLRDLISKLSLDKQVKLLGRLDDLSGFFSSLDLFVVSSRTEGFSLSLVEAMQYGKPSVVTSAGGCIEAARPDQEALVFRSGDSASLAEVIERLIVDENLRTRLANAAIARARDYLTLTRCAAEYEQLYKAVLK